MSFKDQTKTRWVNCVNCNEFTEENPAMTAKRARTLCNTCLNLFHSPPEREKEWNNIKDMTYREVCAQDDWDYNEKHYGDEESV